MTYLPDLRALLARFRPFDPGSLARCGTLAALFPSLDISAIALGIVLERYRGNSMLTYICSLAPIFITISVLGINPGHSHHTVCGASRSGLSHAPCPPRWNSARCPQRAHWRITRHTNSGAGLIAVGHPLPCATLGTKARRSQEFREHNSGSPPPARM